MKRGYFNNNFIPLHTTLLIIYSTRCYAHVWFSLLYVLTYKSQNFGQIFASKSRADLYEVIKNRLVNQRAILSVVCNAKLLSHAMPTRPADGNYDSITSAATNFII